MLGVRTYKQDYIDACRSRVNADISAYKTLVNGQGEINNTEALEARFFNNMVLVLDHFFVHRLRGVEGKDGNPLNEVRVLSDSLMNNRDVNSRQDSQARSRKIGLEASTRR
jgi:hypothetical protein